MKFGAGRVYEGTADYVRYVQTAAILELLHSATGKSLSCIQFIVYSCVVSSYEHRTCMRSHSLVCLQFAFVYGCICNLNSYLDCKCLVICIYAHSIECVLTIGLVRAPMMTTLIQVFSRIFLTWGVVDLFPSSVRNCPAYPVMLVAWSTTEVIRYSFYAWNLLDEVPYPLLWLRYHQLNPF